MTNKQFQTQLIITLVLLGLIWYNLQDRQDNRNCVRLQPVGGYSSGVSDSIK